MLSPVRLSVCNARAPYSGGCNFRQYFNGILYLGHPLTSTKNFTEIVPGNPSVGGVKHKRGSQIYIGWSDVTYLWSQCDRHFVGQHVVLCVVKWWRFVALFEWNSISWFKKMSVLSLSYWESDVYWRQNNRHFAELAPQNGGKQLIWRN